MSECQRAKMWQDADKGLFKHTLLLPHRSMKTLTRDVNVRSETNVCWKLVLGGITGSTY